MSKQTTQAPDTGHASDLEEYISKLEGRNARAEREIVALSQMVMETTSAPTSVGTSKPVDGLEPIGQVVDDSTQRSMFQVMAMTLHLTRVPFIMRLGFFKRRNQRRLAKALTDHGLIDPKWYANTYPEVAKSGQDPALYFVSKGIDAGHMPHPKFANGVSA